MCQAEESYRVYGEKLFVQDTDSAPQLQSTFNNAQYLDAISAPKADYATKLDTKKKPATKKDGVDLTNDSEVAPVRHSVAAGKAKAGSSGAGGR
jgi:DNA-directed RNA polymerase-3 subunit RPC5